MDKDYLKIIIKIADYVIKEHPVWVEKIADITEEQLEELQEAINRSKL